MRNFNLQLIFILAFTTWLSGCAVKNSRLEVKRAVVDGILIEDNTYKPTLIVEEYEIEPPDQLTITVLGHSDLTRQATVRPDGVISIDLIGEIPISGMKVSEAEAFIEAKLVDYLKEVDVTITVNTFSSKNIYVMGRVPNQGPQAYTGKNNVLSALAQAGIPSQGASIQNVLVVRGDKVNPKIIPVNFKDLATKGISGEDVLLRPNDIVLVTPNVFARTADVISTILLPVGPITSPVFTLDSIDDTFGLDLAGTDDDGGSSSSAASDLAGSTAATTGTP